MPFKIVVTELVQSSHEGGEDMQIAIERYSQTVDAISLKAVIAAVNATPRGPRAGAKKDKAA